MTPLLGLIAVQRIGERVPLCFLSTKDYYGYKHQFNYGFNYRSPLPLPYAFLS